MSGVWPNFGRVAGFRPFPGQRRVLCPASRTAEFSTENRAIAVRDASGEQGGMVAAARCGNHLPEKLSCPCLAFLVSR